MRQISRRIRQNDAEAGLTLAETLLVLAILAMAAGLVASRGLPGRGAIRSAALESFLRNARSQAMQTGTPVHLVAAGGQRLDGIGAGFDLGRGYVVQIVSDTAEIGFLPDGTSDGGVVNVQAPDGGSYGAQVAAVTGTVTPIQP